MSLVSKIEIVKKPKQPVLSIKTNTHMKNLPKLISESYDKIENYLKELEKYPGDKPYVRYVNMNMENLELELGFPVYKELPGKGNIEASYLPEMKAAYTIYSGPYQEMGPSYD